MRKYNLTIAFFLIFTGTLFLCPLNVFSAPNTVVIGEDSSVDIWGNSITLTLKAGGQVAGFTVYSTYLSVDMENDSRLTIVSADGYTMTASPAIAVTSCDTPSSGRSQISLTSTTTQTVTVTPSTTRCASSGGSSGGGGGGSTTVVQQPVSVVPTTTTGEVTATVVNGGKTTITTSETGTASVELPANAVASSTVVKINAENKADITPNYPIEAGKSMVGGFVYNFSATSGGAAVTNFSKDVTLIFTYLDSQIVGLNEDTLKVYYWDGSKWADLGGTLDKANNKINVLSNHFTYFVVMGDLTVPSETARPEDYGLKEGDLIRAEGDFDIFIINQYGYKRLFLNPAIFNMYGHLGGWEAVKTVTPATRDAFVTSTLYRYVDAAKVYHLEVTGQDTGTLQWINMTAEDFTAQGGKANAVFLINKAELDWYPKGVDKTSL